MATQTSALAAGRSGLAVLVAASSRSGRSTAGQRPQQSTGGRDGPGDSDRPGAWAGAQAGARTLHLQRDKPRGLSSRVGRRSRTWAAAWPVLGHSPDKRTLLLTVVLGGLTAVEASSRPPDRDHRLADDGVARIAFSCAQGWTGCEPSRPPFVHSFDVTERRYRHRRAAGAPPRPHAPRRRRKRRLR